MKSIIEEFDQLNENQPQCLEELRLGPEPTMVIAFTRDVEDVSFHYEDDESARGYIVCPGENCPACHLGAQPVPTWLLPAYSIEDEDIRVLRIPKRRAASSLATHLMPLLRRPDIGDQMLLITRNGAKYAVEARTLAKNASRGEAAMSEFLARWKEGLKLSSAFVHLTPEEYAEVPRIRRKLDARGDYLDTGS